MLYHKNTDVRARHVFRQSVKNPHQLIRVLSDRDTDIPGGGEAVCSSLDSLVSSGNVTCASLPSRLSVATHTSATFFWQF